MRPVTPRELVDLALAHESVLPPGTGWEYSNTNYIVLGMMLERLEGKPIARIIRDSHPHTTHGLNETFFEGGEPIALELSPATSSRWRASIYPGPRGLT
jgi:D-alanyl-D-alanine carboxypeptidase